VILLPLLVDHIIANDSQHQLQPAVIEKNLTDHYPFICIIKQAKSNHNHNGNVTHYFYTDKSKFKDDIFCKDLKNNLRLYFSQKNALNMKNFNMVFSGVARVFAARGRLKNSAPYFCSKNL